MLRALNDNRLLDRYFEIRAQIDELEEELERVKPELLSALFDEPEQETHYAGHELTIGTRRSYEYPDEIKEMERHLKAAKDYARATGDAVCVRHSSFLVAKRLKAT